MSHCWWNSAIALALATLAAAGCSRRIYDGPERPVDQIAVVDLGDVSLRNVDNRFDFFTPFGVQRIEIEPGRHRIAFVFERQATTIGVRDIPYRLGEGVCTLDFVAEAGKRYRLDAAALDDDSNSRDWEGEWRGWISDASLDAGNDIIARCTPTERAPSPPPVRDTARAQAPSPPPAGDTAQARAARLAVPTPAPVVAPPPVAPAAPPPPLPVVAPAPTPAQTPSAEQPLGSIRLGGWNLRSQSDDGERDYTAIAAVIGDNFDILTLTEIPHRNGGPAGYRRLLSALGGSWAGMVTDSPRPNVDTLGAEHYAILYRTDRIRTCAGWQQLRYVTDNDGSATGTGPDRFEREPAFGCFEAGFELGKARLDFILAAYRATWAGGDSDATAAEVANVDAALEEMVATRPGERDGIVAGQLNLDTVELELFTSAAIVTKGSGSTLNLLGEPTYGMRDHILIRTPSGTIETIGPGVVLDVRGIADSPREFRRTVSNHLPVAVVIRIPEGDRD